MRFLYLLAAVVLFLAIFGCTGAQPQPNPPTKDGVAYSIPLKNIVIRESDIPTEWYSGTAKQPLNTAQEFDGYDNVSHILNSISMEPDKLAKLDANVRAYRSTLTKDNGAPKLVTSFVIETGCVCDALALFYDMMYTNYSWQGVKRTSLDNSKESGVYTYYLEYKETQNGSLIGLGGTLVRKNNHIVGVYMQRINFRGEDNVADSSKLADVMVKRLDDEYSKSSPISETNCFYGHGYSYCPD